MRGIDGALAASTVVALAVVAVLAVALIRRTVGTRPVYAWEHGLLYVDGRFARVLPPGAYRRGLLREHLVVRLRAGACLLPVPAVEVVSADRLPYRLAGTLTYEIVDPRAAHEGEHRAALALAASDALVRVAAARSLEAALSDRPGLSAGAFETLARSVAGCRLDALTVTGLTLPPELRRLTIEVERARLEGLAALERARGEHAALRSLANAARLIRGNPELAHLRLLQALPTGGKGATLVLGRDALPDAAPLRDGRATDPDGEPA